MNNDMDYLISTLVGIYSAVGGLSSIVWIVSYVFTAIADRFHHDIQKNSFFFSDSLSGRQIPMTISIMPIIKNADRG